MELKIKYYVIKCHSNFVKKKPLCYGSIIYFLKQFRRLLKHDYCFGLTVFCYHIPILQPKFNIFRLIFFQFMI